MQMYTIFQKLSSLFFFTLSNRCAAHELPLTYKYTSFFPINAMRVSLLRMYIEFDIPVIVNIICISLLYIQYWDNFYHQGISLIFQAFRLLLSDTLFL